MTEKKGRDYDNILGDPQFDLGSEKLFYVAEKETNNGIFRFVVVNGEELKPYDNIYYLHLSRVEKK